MATPMIFRLLFLLLILCAATPAHAMRCNGRLVQIGDHASQARQRCGEPYWIDRYSDWLILGEYGPLEQRVERNVEVWYYNFGSNRFLQRLVFRDDRLQHEENLGYGFGKTRRDCKPMLLPPGTSNGEIIARCGAPQSRRERYGDVTERDGNGNARTRVTRHEDWIYDTDSSRDYYLLLIVDGALSKTERLQR